MPPFLLEHDDVIRWHPTISGFLSLLRLARKLYVNRKCVIFKFGVLKIVHSEKNVVFGIYLYINYTVDVSSQFRRSEKLLEKGQQCHWMQQYRIKDFSDPFYSLLPNLVEWHKFTHTLNIICFYCTKVKWLYENDSCFLFGVISYLGFCLQ